MNTMRINQANGDSVFLNETSMRGLQSYTYLDSNIEKDKGTERY